MALNDVKILDMGSVTTRTYQVDAGTANSIKAGEPVKQHSDGSPYVLPLATGDPELGTDMFMGIAATTSTDTATVDGLVDVHIVTPGITEMECKATTAANVDTAAEILALVNDCVTFDLTSTTYTIDEDEGNDNNVHGLIITGGNATEKTLRFVAKTQMTQAGAAL